MTADEWDRLAQAIEYPAADAARLQEAYVQAFDFDPACSLEMGWHLFGERPERGTFLAALREDLAAAGVPERGNLPDYLPTLLRLIGRQAPPAAATLAGAIEPAAARVLEQIKARENPFAAALASIVQALAATRQQEARS